MENEIQIFKNEQFGLVRTVTKDGEPWFVGKDVAEILGYSNARKTLNDHVDSEDKGVTKCDTLGGTQNLTVINESGLYSLILSSKLPKAKEFKRWVTSEILPTIRKTGGYVNKEDTFIDTYLPFADESTKALFRNTLEVVRQQNKRIEQMRPKEIFADAVSTSDTSILVRDLAKLIRQNGVDIGERRLWKWLRENGFICVSDTSPTQKSMNMRLFEVVERTIERGDGNPIIKSTTKVTGKGQQYFINRFLGDKK